MSKRFTGHLALLGTNLFFAINLSAIKHFTTPGDAGPYGINVVRVGVSVLVFWVLYLFNRNKLPIERKDIGRFILCAIAALGVNLVLFVKGLSLTYSIHASLLLLITPILITFSAAWLLKERLTSNKIAGLALGICGAVILIASGHSTGKGNDIVMGDVMVILSAIAYTFYFILVKPLMHKYPPIHVMRWVFTFGFIMVLPIGWMQFSAIQWHRFSSIDWLLMAQIVVPGTVLAYIFNVYGIKKLSASVAGTYIYTQPVFAVIIAMIFLKEDLSLYKVVSGILIFSGVYLVNKRKSV